MNIKRKTDGFLLLCTLLFAALATACSTDSVSFPAGDADSDTDTDSDSDSDSDGDAPGDVVVDESFGISGNIRSECSTGAPMRPFGSVQAAYFSGSLMPDLPYADLSKKVEAVYDNWKTTFLGNSSACGADRYFVKASRDNKVSVSEGHGYGMLIMAYMAGYEPDARTYFDGMVRYYQDHPSGISPALMAWAQDASCNSSDGEDSATDGDMDIAYALLLAHKQWGSSSGLNYLSLAETLIDSIMENEVDSGNNYLMLGDWTAWGGEKSKSTRPSDFMPGHMASFELLKGTGEWRDLRNSMYRIFADVQNQYAPNSGFFPDFIIDAASDPAPAPADFHESEYDGDYYYNACRVPWRLGVDYLNTGNKTSQRLMARINYFIQNSAGSAANIAVGYTLGGAPIETTYTSWAFSAPFGPGAMVSTDNGYWVNSLWNYLQENEPEGYFEDTLKLMSLIVMSGNWWAPQDVDC